MEQISELMIILGQLLNWNKWRRDCLSKAILSLIKVRNVNLQELAIGLGGKAQIDSRYKRLYRFLRFFEIDLFAIARWLFKLFFLPGQSIYIAIDRTNWYWGKKNINVFMLSVCYEGIAIPLYWKVLDKDGSTNAQEQIDFINRFLLGFGEIKIGGLLADREFANGDFFSWLKSKKIPFYIRIKEDSVIRMKGKRLYKVKRLFRDVNPLQHRVAPMQIEIFGVNVYLWGSRSESGELMVVATDQSHQNAIAIYLRRWEIENLFQSLKGRGFRFEDTHLTKPERIEKLMVILALGFCLAHKTGEWRAQQRPIRFKKHRDSHRPQYSFFRYGLDFIRDLLLQPTKKIPIFRKILSLLTPLNLDHSMEHVHA
jgi:Transposase DDE domain